VAAIVLDALDTYGHVRRCLFHRLIHRIDLLDRTLAIVKEKISIEIIVSTIEDCLPKSQPNQSQKTYGCRHTDKKMWKSSLSKTKQFFTQDTRTYLNRPRQTDVCLKEDYLCLITEAPPNPRRIAVDVVLERINVIDFAEYAVLN